EDSAFYCYNRLVSLNEVGGDPGRFGTTLDCFHEECAEIQERWPLTMVTTSTHDHKRGEDARVRISALAEMPDDWERAVQAWTSHNERYRDGGILDHNAEY